MNDALIVSAGCLGMGIAIIHGRLGETKVVRPVHDLPATSKRVLRAVMFLSALYWFAGGLLLVIGPVYLTAPEQVFAALAIGAMYLTGAVGNFWATRGRHIGWVLLACAAGLAWTGVWLQA